MAKSADAFRTISEVADWLETPAHVLRFWESKFSQVKPVKRAGGRRYYRPADMQLLGGIKKLLHDDGMTIKGVQKILREQGIKHVCSFSQPLDDLMEISTVDPRQESRPDADEGARILHLPTKDRTREAETPEPVAQIPPEEIAIQPQSPPVASEETAAPGVATGNQEPAEQSVEAATPAPVSGPPAEETGASDDAPDSTAATPDDVGEVESAPTGPDAVSEDPERAPDQTPVIPTFSHRRLPQDPAEPPAREIAPDQPDQQPLSADPPELPAPAPGIHVDVPDDPDDSVAAESGLISKMQRLPRPLPRRHADALSVLLERLARVAESTPGGAQG